MTCPQYFSDGTVGVRKIQNGVERSPCNVKLIHPRIVAVKWYGLLEFNIFSFQVLGFAQMVGISSDNGIGTVCLFYTCKTNKKKKLLSSGSLQNL